MDAPNEDLYVHVYGGDNFYPIANFHCMPIKLGEIGDTVIDTALNFARDKFRKSRATALRQSLDEGDTPKKNQNQRFILSISLDEMKGCQWFQSILKTINEVLESIDSKLVVKKFAILKANAKCPQQAFHYDNEKLSRKKRYSVIFSIMKGTSMVFKDANDSNQFHWSLGLPPKAGVVFHDWCLHAGAGYPTVNYRFFFAASEKDGEEEEEEEAQRIDTIVCEVPQPENVWHCKYCKEKTGRISPTSNSGRSNKNKHQQVCLKYLKKVEGLDETEALKRIAIELEKRRKSARKSMAKKRARDNQE